MTDPRRARTAFVWVGVIVPLAILLLAGAVVLAWLPDVPDPSAMHWSGDGPDGFGPRWINLMPIGIGVVLVLLFAAIALFAPSTQSHQPGPAALSSRSQATPATTGRLLGATSLGLAAMMSLLSLAVVGVQRGLDDAVDAPDITGWMLVGFGSAALLGVIGWFLQPKTHVAAAGGTPAGSIPLSTTTRAAWFGTATMARSGLMLLLAALALLVVMTVFWAARGDDGWWILAVVTIVIGLTIGGTSVFRVRVSAAGLRARSLLGWPDNRIPLERIDKVETVQIDPFREFGGWGWRLSMDGRRGIVLRTGEALQITQTDGRVFVVTVDGANDAAAVLQSLRSR